MIKKRLLELSAIAEIRCVTEINMPKIADAAALESRQAIPTFKDNLSHRPLLVA
jgi:hypothetical protein